jgi:pilus assembly protein Flp/PilA
MQRIRNMWAHLADAVTNESGQGLIEYALIVSLISVVAVVALALTGTNVTSALTTVANAI